MVIFLALNFLIGNFYQKFYLDKGITGGTRGRIMVCDTDRDSKVELIFAYYENFQEKVVVYELYPDNIFHLQAIIDTMSGEAWDVGDFDNDGLFDLVLTGDFGLPVVGPQIYESSDSFSYPTQEVWRDTVGSALVTPICTYDIDQDIKPEIVKVLGDYIHLHIYESVGDNLYDKIAEITTVSTHNSSSTLAFGDFDVDDQNEFVWGYSAGEYSIYECTGNNSYQEIILQQLPTLNIKDCFSIPDADSDGKMEFVVKGDIWPTALINAFIFEAIGDNTYEIIKTFDLFGGSNSYYGGYSDAGDVDGDSIPEIVLESCQNVYIIKSAGNDSFYIRDTLPGNVSGSSVRVTNDIDGNGYNEIVISGNDETRIYEYDVGGIEKNALRSTPYALRFLEVYPNPFSKCATIVFGKAQSTSQYDRTEGAALKIYDAMGRLVKSFLLHTSNFPLPISVVWSGCDHNGNRLESGVYFVRLEAGDFEKTEKVILLR